MGKSARNRQRVGSAVPPADSHRVLSDAEIDAAVADLEAQARYAVATRYADRVSLTALGELWQVRLEAEDRAARMVVTLRKQGVSWAAIGRVTGVTPQGAMARWRRLVDVADGGVPS